MSLWNLVSQTTWIWVHASVCCFLLQRTYWTRKHSWKEGFQTRLHSLVRVFIGKETETGLRQIPASTQNHAWIWQTFLFLLYVKATCETCTPATSQNKHGGGLIPWREDGGDSNMGKVGGCWGNWDREHKVLQNLQEPEGGLSLEHSFTAYKKGFYGNHIMHSVHLCECV